MICGFMRHFLNYSIYMQQKRTAEDRPFIYAGKEPGGCLQKSGLH